MVRLGRDDIWAFFYFVKNFLMDINKAWKQFKTWDGGRTNWMKVWLRHWITEKYDKNSGVTKKLKLGLLDMWGGSWMEAEFMRRS